MTQGQFLSGVWQVWIQSFPSPRLVASLRLKNLVCPTILPIAGGRIIGFIPFLRVLVLCEMQSASSRIWTRDWMISRNCLLDEFRNRELSSNVGSGDNFGRDMNHPLPENLSRTTMFDKGDSSSLSLSNIGHVRFKLISSKPLFHNYQQRAIPLIVSLDSGLIKSLIEVTAFLSFGGGWR